MKIQIESSTACNARCTFCPRYDMTRPMGEMSDELFYKIISDCRKLRQPYIVPFLNGEPFVFSRIWEWLDYLRDKGLRVYLTTNAEFIDVERIVKYPNIREVCCSVNAATPETHKAVMRGPDYEKVVNNVKKLIKMAQFRVSASMVVVSANRHEIDEFKAIWGKYASIGAFKNWAGARHDETEVTGKRIPCLSLLRGMTILWDGRVVPCCLDHNGKLILGDANKESLGTIWRRSKWLREKHYALDFDYEPCKNCNQNIV